MNTDKLYHYVYRITNTTENKHYYGVRSCNTVPESDLGVKYFSSSTDKSFIHDQKDNPKRYKYKVVKCFASRIDAVSLEVKLHNKFNVGINPKFYNKAKQSSSKFDITGFKFSEESRLKISKACTGRVHSEEAKERMRKACAGRYIGRKLTEEHKYKIGESLLGGKRTAETKAKMSKAQVGVNNPAAKLANVYDYRTNELVAEGVIIRVWSREVMNDDGSGLNKTIRADRSIPSSSKNPHHHKGLYAKYL